MVNLKLAATFASPNAALKYFTTDVDTLLSPKDSSTSSSSNESDHQSMYSDNSSDVEADRPIPRLIHHTVVFKVIGCTKEAMYQDTLYKAKCVLESGNDVTVKLDPEPTNPQDSQAVAFVCLLERKQYRIGYVVREILPDVHSALNNNEIVDVKFGWIKYRSDWRSGPGYFAGVKVTKIGQWSRSVVRAASARL